MNESKRIICLTPCRNEAWVLGIQVHAASQWADRVVVGDQMSTDDTREVLSTYAPKAMVVDNVGLGYDEGERHRVVFEAARRLFQEERKILLAIDSDELLSANWRTSPEWDAIRSLPPGSGIYASWANVNPDFQTWFPLGGPFIIGVVDDGKLTHSPGQFHVPRLLQDPDKPKFFMKEIRLLHLQYTDPQRSASKNRAYQLQEWIVNPTRPIRLFRRFNSTLKIRTRDIQPIRPEWVSGFEESQIDWKSIRIDGKYRWDRLCLEAILEHGERFFRRLDIWDVDWNRLAEYHGIDVKGRTIKDPRSPIEKRVHAFLRRTQPYMEYRTVRMVQWALRCFKW